MLHNERICVLKNAAEASRGSYVLYWMQASQRASCNHALEYAIRQANRMGKPLVVFFGITDAFPDANLRHYRFMLEGLADTSQRLHSRGIQLVVQKISPVKGVVALSRNAVLTVTDRGYLSIQRRWRSDAARHIPCPLIQVETDVVVPVETASSKEHYSAATIRSSIRRHLNTFLQPLKETSLKKDSLAMECEALDITHIEDILPKLDIDRSVPPSSLFHGGHSEASAHLSTFVDQKLDRYHDLRNDPSCDCLSHMSPYLHFGHISPLEIALRVKASGKKGADAYLEELIVRRELSMNYVFYNPHYGTFGSLPAWAQKTLAEHQNDQRGVRYSLSRLDQAATHDPYWNAAQKEMRFSGKMHGYMRMYWGKKILEWSPSPEKAFQAALHLNNKYFLDGRDPNGYAGVAWCFGKHDRAWSERPVFGKVRYMNDKGLRRKFDMDAYLKKVEHMCRQVA